MPCWKSNCLSSKKQEKFCCCVKNKEQADLPAALPGLSGEVARHSAGRAALGGAAGLYRWNADELDEERNGKLRMENGKLA